MRLYVLWFYATGNFGHMAKSSLFVNIKTDFGPDSLLFHDFFQSGLGY